jgi:hypothetical protein
MAEYRDRTTGEIKTQGELRRENSNMSLPKKWNQNVLDALNVDPLIHSFAPTEGIGQYQTAVLTGETEQDSSGNWKRTREIVDMFADLTDEDGNIIQTKAEQEAEYQTQLDEGSSVSNRTKRDMFIAETDWWAMSDRTMTAEQTAYRQALRDITSHANWPHLEDADWPTKP